MAEAFFRTNVLLKSIIGKDLITDDNIAVLELVKNSFDANSKSVDIVFDNVVTNDDKILKGLPTKRTSTILIRDQGKGMSADDIRNKWLNIAYSEKKQKREDFGRMLAGNKGVGRFSCDRLGEYLNIYTREKGSATIVHLFIDWKMFEVEGEIKLNIQDIALSIDEIPVEDFQRITGRGLFKQGTLLEISKLREPWAHDKLISLKRQLERLINPNQAFKLNAFSINLIAPEYAKLDGQKKEEFSRINGEVTNRVFDNLNFRTSSIHAHIDASGETITTELQHKGNIVFTLIEKNTFSALKDIKATIYYLNPYAKVYFNKQTGIRLVEFGSISLFINGFRIPPYGDQGDDWLGMEARKGQGFSRYLGTRETVGRIEINDYKEQFKIISSRSGVVNNEPFEQLTASRSPYGFFFKTFRRLERFVVEGIKFDSAVDDGVLIENTINKAGKKWRETNEVYSEDSLTKNKRILTVISNIIDVRANDIISLDINKEFVQEVIEEQIESSSKELDKIVKEIANKELKPHELTSLINRLEGKAQEMDQFSNSVAERTGGSVEDKDRRFEEIRQLFERKQKELEREKNILEAKLATEAAEKKKIEDAAAADKKKLQDELEAEKKENLFSKKLASTDITAVVGLQHHIDRATDKILSSINSLIGGIENGAPKSTLLKQVAKIDLENKMIASIVQFVTNANYNLKATIIEKDLNRFIREYITNVYQEYTHVKRNAAIINTNVVSDNKPFIYKFRPLEIVIIIDNLLSNSVRANARNIEVELTSNEQELTLTFADDGNGILESALPRIYNLGFTTTEGSGIGLHHVKQIVDKLKGEISVDSKTGSGTVFTITIPHHEA